MPNVRTLLHPELPLCWEDTRTLRVGFDRAVARISDPSPAAQRFLAALRLGVRSSDLTTTAAALGLSASETEALLGELAPALVQRTPHGPGADDGDALGRLEVAFVQRGDPVLQLVRHFAAAGCRIVERGDDPADLVLVTERFLDPLGRASALPDPEVPQLLVRFTDRSLVVGPLSTAETRPCFDCVTLGEVDADPGLPALAVQLTGAKPASETRAAAEVAAVIALAVIRRWIGNEPDVHATRLRAPVRGGVVAGLPRLERLSPHARCACAWNAAGAGDASR